MAKGPLSPRPSVLLDVLKTAFFAAARIVVFFLFISLSLSRIRDGENRPHSERRRQSLPSVFSVEVNKVPWKEFSRQSSNNEKLSRKWHRYLFRRKIVRLFTKARKLEKRNLIAIVFFRNNFFARGTNLPRASPLSFVIDRRFQLINWSIEGKKKWLRRFYPILNRAIHLAFLISYALSLVTFARGESGF